MGKRTQIPSSMYRKRLLKLWRSLLLVALACGTGCVVTATAKVPECPPWTDRAIVEYDAAQGYDPIFIADVVDEESPRYPWLDAQLGEIARVCDALKAANGERNGCSPDTWTGRVGLLLSLECGE